MNLLRTVLVVGLSVLCFALGREVASATRGSSVTVSVSHRSPVDSQVRRDPRPSSMTSNSNGDSLRIAARALPSLPQLKDSAWNQLVEENAARATAIHQAVLGVMEVRRRGLQWSECLSAADYHGRSKLRVMVDIRAEGSGLLVENASSTEVEEGEDISPKSLSCINARLGGHDEIGLDEPARTYVGPAPFYFTVDFGP